MLREHPGQDYPLHIRSVHGLSHLNRVLKNEAELVSAIYEELNKDHNKGKKLEQIVCEEFGFLNTMILVDEFSMFLINEYEYYKSTASGQCPYDYAIWRDAVILFEQLQPRLF